jgi:hypothetical protein
MTEKQYTAFSSSGEDAISRIIDLEIDETTRLPSSEFEVFYEIKRTANEIVKRNFKRVSQISPERPQGTYELLAHIFTVSYCDSTIGSTSISRRIIA